VTIPNSHSIKIETEFAGSLQRVGSPALCSAELMNQISADSPSELRPQVAQKRSGHRLHGLAQMKENWRVAGSRSGNFHTRSGL
jgi:hypothetical protein